MTTVNVIKKKNSDLRRAAIRWARGQRPLPHVPWSFPLYNQSLSLFQSCGDPDETQAQRGCCCLRSPSWEVAEQSLRRWPASLPPTSDLGAPEGQSPNLLTSGPHQHQPGHQGPRVWPGEYGRRPHTLDSVEWVREAGLDSAPTFLDDSVQVNFPPWASISPFVKRRHWSPGLFTSFPG